MTTAPKPASPRRALSALAETSPDVLIIGGGINGISLLRDLSLQGVQVALIDRGDVMSGASAASSHMVHGGIRYLENGEFRLVRESVRERNDLLRTAPHVVKPLRTTVPVYSLFSGLLQAPLRMVRHGGGRRRERGALLIGVGLVIYESFSRGGKAMPRFRFAGRRRSLEELPSLDPRVACTAVYYDASMHEPERLALDLVTDAVATGNARVVTYASAVGTRDGGVMVLDEVTGADVVVRARIVVNASGPFADLTNASLGTPSQFMGGTKGSHIVVDHPELFRELDGRELFFENSDGRIVLIYPVKGRILIGTTDVFADPSQPVLCTEEEIDYFFDLVSRVLPGFRLDRSQIVFRFAGIRPLPRQDVTQPGFVSRDYRVERGTLPGAADVPLVTVVGGKWTTFRALGEHVTGDILALLGLPRRVGTRGRAIGGGKALPQSAEDRAAWVAGRAGAVPAERVAVLLERYGTRAALLLADLAAGETPLSTLPGYSIEEIAFLVRTEHVVHLDDVLLRRTPLAFTGELDAERVEEIADAVGASLGWTADERAAEIERASATLAERHGVNISRLASLTSVGARVRLNTQANNE